MIRFLAFLVALAAFTWGLVWFMDHPGTFVVAFQGYRVETSLLTGLAGVLSLAIVLGVVWSLFRFIFGIPSLLSHASKARRRRHGLAALSRGMVAAGAGDVKAAQRAADEALRLMPAEPLSLLLKAQAAQLGGNREAASAAFTTMLDKPETRLLGLRGLHMEARRRGDDDAAHDLAKEAHRIAPLPWAGQAVLEHKTGQADWQGALATLDANVAARSMDRKLAGRQRAVLQTAIALDKAGAEPDAALQLARDALKTAPGLVPAAVLAGRLLTRRGDIRRAGKVIEAAWAEGTHPDLARAYLDVRPGDSTSDRFARAKVLARMRPSDPESALLMARAAMDTRDFAAAREALRPLVDGESRPTARTCLMMAQLEETEKGATGPVREWLARASRAPRDKAWVADGVISDTWAPVSPVNGRIDAFEWRTPNEQLSAHVVDWHPAEPAAAGEPELVEAVAEPLQLTAAAQVPEAMTDMSAVTPAEARLAPRVQSTPVIFARPNAPDDPGAAETAGKPGFGFLPRD